MTLEISVQIWTPGGHKKKSEKENKTGLTLLGDTIEYHRTGVGLHNLQSGDDH